MTRVNYFPGDLRSSEFDVDDTRGTAAYRQAQSLGVCEGPAALETELAKARATHATSPCEDLRIRIPAMELALADIALSAEIAASRFASVHERNASRTASYRL